MKTNKYVVTFAALVSLITLNTGTMAASATDKLLLYHFVPTAALNKDMSTVLLKRYLPEASEERLQAMTDGVVRYVSPQSETTTFEHDLATGDLRFLRHFERYLGDFVPMLPPADQAERLAYYFLKANDLFPANPAELKLAHLGGLRAASVINGEQAGAVIDKAVTLTFQREIQGIPVIGPGSKIVVELGDQGEVLGVIRQWRELLPDARPIEPDEMYPLDEAARLAQDEIKKEFGEQSRTEFLANHVAYFDNMGKLLQPVYAFQVRVTLPDDRAQAFDYVRIIPMMRNTPEAINLTEMDPAALRNVMTATPESRTGKARRAE